MKITQAKTLCSQKGSYFTHINVSHKPFSLHLRSLSGLFKFVFGNSVNTFLHMVNDIQSSIPDPDPQSLTLNLLVYKETCCASANPVKNLKKASHLPFGPSGPCLPSSPLVPSPFVSVATGCENVCFQLGVNTPSVLPLAATISLANTFTFLTP